MRALAPVQWFVSIILSISLILLPLPAARATGDAGDPSRARDASENCLAKTSIFAAQSILFQRLLKIAEMLEEVFDHDLVLDDSLIQRIRLRDRPLHDQLIAQYQREQRLFFDLRSLGNLVIMNARLSGAKRNVVFFDRRKVPWRELRALGMDSEKDVEFISMGFYIVPSTISPIQKAKLRALRSKPIDAIFTDPVEQTIFEQALADTVDNMLPHLEQDKKDQLADKLQSDFQPFTPSAYLKTVLMYQAVAFSFAVSFVVVLFKLSPFVAVLGTICLMSYAAVHLYFFCLICAREDVAHVITSSIFLPTCFLKIAFSKDRNFNIRKIVSHEAIHLLHARRLIKQDLPTAHAYATYLMLCASEAIIRSHVRPEKVKGTFVPRFHLTLEMIEEWEKGVLHGLSHGVQEAHDEKQCRALEREFFFHALDLALPWLKGFRLFQVLFGTIGGERAYYNDLGGIYAGQAYAYARRAGNQQAGMDFIRMLSGGAGLYEINKELAKRYDLLTHAALLVELQEEDYDGNELSDASL